MINKKRLIYLLVAFTAVLTILLGIGADIKILEFNNGKIIRSRYMFFYETDPELKLASFRKKHELDKVIKTGKNEFEKIVLLREWTNRQRIFEREDENFSIIDLMEDRPGRSGGECSEVAAVFVQVCSSMGYHARILSTAKNDRSGHWTVEVWSNEYSKWIVMDPYFNCYYSDGDIPQGALEIHKKIMKKAGSGITVISNGKRQSIEDITGRVSLFTHLAVFMNNAFISFSRQTGEGHIRLRPLRWKDEFTSGLNVFSHCPHTEIESDFNWNLNQCEIHIEDIDPDNAKLQLRLETNTPFFSHFVLQRNGATIEFTTDTNPSMFWYLKPGSNVLRIKAVNSFGVEGRESSITVRYGLLAIWGIAWWD